MFAALLALTTALWCRTAARVAGPHAVWWMPSVVVGFIAVQWACGIVLYSGHALLGAMYVAGIAMAWWLGAASIRMAPEPKHWLAVAATVLLLAATFSGVLETMQWLRLETDLNIYAVERAPGERPSGNLAQPNLLASLLVMGTVAAGMLWRMRYLRSWQAGVLLIYLSFTLVMTESRAGLLSAACVGALVLLRARHVGWPGGTRAVLMWWLLLVLFWLSWAPLNEALLLQPARELEARVDNVRLVLWTQILSAILQRPWWGYGWSQTPVAQKFGVAAAPGEWPTHYAHNVALDVIAWFGIPLGLVMLVGAVWWLGRSLRRMKNATELLLLCLAMPVLVHSQLEFPFAYAFFLFPLACMLGALHALQMPSSWPLMPALASGRRAAAAALLTVYALVAGRVFVEYLDAEADLRVMRFELRRLGQRPVDHEAPELLLLNQLDEMLKVGRMVPSRGMTTEDLARMARANAFQNWATLHLNYVIALGLNGQPEEARRQLRVLRDLYGPKSFAQARAELDSQREHWYPELAAVKFP